MKKVLVFILTICMLATLIACSSTTTVIESSEDTDTTTTTTEQANNENQETDETTANEDTDTEQTTAQGKGTRPTSKTKKTTTPNTTGVTPTTKTTAKTTRKTVATVDKSYATDRKLKVACVGDSITAQGYWKSNLDGKLSTANYEVQGFGKSGATALFKGVDYVNASTNAGKAYVDQAEYTNSMNYGADIVVIMLGTNDSKEEVNWKPYGDDFIDDYIEIVESYQKSAGNPMVFIALPPTAYDSKKWQGISNEIIEEEIIPALYVVAGATGAIIIDTHTPTGGDSSMVSDGVHPSAAGKKVLCETIAAAIKADTGRS